MNPCLLAFRLVVLELDARIFRAFVGLPGLRFRVYGMREWIRIVVHDNPNEYPYHPFPRFPP